MATLINLALIILGFGLLIFVHELGHFLAAKWAGIRTEAFAIGMGQPVLSWRKGIGLRLGSTEREYVRRAEQSLVDQRGGSVEFKEQASFTREQIYMAADQLGLGETEYSLRWLPIGGFVKMLGQDDADPSARSSHPRSYNMRPIGKRMIVVSAGVIMNLLLAAGLFIFVFLVGVKFEAPVIGDVSPDMPAAVAGLQSGDVITHIDDVKVATFADVQIATAMSRPGQALRITVARDGEAEPLHFTVMPAHDSRTGLLGIGIAPGASNKLVNDSRGELEKILAAMGLAQQGVEPGMTLVSAEGLPIQRYQQFADVVENSDGQPVRTKWGRLDENDQTTSERLVEATIDVEPEYSLLLYPENQGADTSNYEMGLLGFVPLTKVGTIENAAVKDLLREGDVILRGGSLNAPKLSELQAEVKRHAGESIDLLVQRGEEEIEVSVPVDRKGLIGVHLGWATRSPRIAEPMPRVRRSLKDADRDSLRTMPVEQLRLAGLGGSTLVAVNGTPVSDWPSFRAALRLHTKNAAETASGATVTVALRYPTVGGETEALPLSLSAEDVADLHKLAWAAEIYAAMFDEIKVVRSADGNPLRAVTMGVEETRKLVMMTYLTIDRLIRGSVGVEQLRGPVGIVHFGAQIADKGIIYLIFLLAVISVNLAVINFLPLPIVDGGLFLFLIYEKFKGRPPSVAFQNAATIVGLCLIGTMFLVVTWNDVMRLVN